MGEEAKNKHKKLICKTLSHFAYNHKMTAYARDDCHRKVVTFPLLRLSLLMWWWFDELGNFLFFSFMDWNSAILP